MTTHLKTLICTDKTHCDALCALLAARNVRFIRYDSKRVTIDSRAIDGDAMELCGYHAIEANEHEAAFYFGDDGK